MITLRNVKVLLGLDVVNTEKDELLNLYIERATNFVKTYCNQEEVNEGMKSIIEDIAVFFYRNKGVENVISESKGRLVETFREGLPSDIYKRLNNNRRLRFK